MKHKPPYTSFLQKLIILIVITFILPNLLPSCRSQKDSIFEGHFSSSFEVSVFFPCGTESVESIGDQDSGYWLNTNPGSGFNEQLETFLSKRGPTGELNLYVKFVGTRSPTKQNGYGHLGMYSDQITVREVLDMKPWAEAYCQ